MAVLVSVYSNVTETSRTTLYSILNEVLWSLHETHRYVIIFLLHVWCLIILYWNFAGQFSAKISHQNQSHLSHQSHVSHPSLSQVLYTAGTPPHPVCCTLGWLGVYLLIYFINFLLTINTVWPKPWMPFSSFPSKSTGPPNWGEWCNTFF